MNKYGIKYSSNTALMTCHYYFHVFFWVWLCLIDDALDFEYDLRNRFDLFAKLRDIAKSQRKRYPPSTGSFQSFRAVSAQV